MKTLIVILIACLAVSCSPFLINTQKYEILNQDLEIAWKHTSSYSYIAHISTYTKSPKEFESDGGGMCKDFSTNLVYYLGNESSMLIIEFPNGDKHAIVEYDGKYIEPQVYNMYYTENEFIITAKIDYYSVMVAYTNYGQKSIY